jgi:hypothetical protein
MHVLVGLENRDWYREEPSAAWNDWRGPKASPPAPTPGPASRVPTSFGVGALLVLAAILVGCGLLARAGIPEVGSTPTTAPWADALRFELPWSRELVTRTTAPTRWTLRDPRFPDGALVVDVPAGRYPFEVITHVLTARGFEVALPWRSTGQFPPSHSTAPQRTLGPGAA